jgi:hypothetical protein
MYGRASPTGGPLSELPQGVVISRAEWYLGELGIAYEPINLDMRKGEHKQPAYLAINPFGKVCWQGSSDRVRA